MEKIQFSKKSVLKGMLIVIIVIAYFYDRSVRNEKDSLFQLTHRMIIALDQTSDKMIKFDSLDFYTNKLLQLSKPEDQIRIRYNSVDSAIDFEVAKKQTFKLVDEISKSLERKKNITGGVYYFLLITSLGLVLFMEYRN